MQRASLPHPDQLRLDLDQAEIERLIEARVAARAQAEASRWRFRLVAIETVMMAALVTAAGLTLGQPVGAVIEAALLIGASCFGTGTLLLGLSAGTGRAWSRVRAWRAR